MHPKKPTTRPIISTMVSADTFATLDAVAACLGIRRNKVIVICLERCLPELVREALTKMHAALKLPADPKAELPAVHLPEVK